MQIKMLIAEIPGFVCFFNALNMQIKMLIAEWFIFEFAFWMHLDMST